MKINHSCLLPCFAMILSLALSHAMADQVITNENLPDTVPFKLGSSAFAPGDNIAIKELRGTSKKVAIGGTYSVEGTYTLSSRDEATLAFFDTSVGPSGPTPVDPKQRIYIKRGSGTFYLVKTMHDDGYLHVSFYSHESFGGVYFGQGDRVYHEALSLQSANDSLTRSSPEEPPSFSGPNKTLFDYLGNPVMPPPDMDAHYTGQGLTDAIHLAAQRAGITVKGVTIDDSEFPFIVGVVCGGSDFPKLKNELRQMSDYEYGGGVGNDVNSDGSDTCNVFNIVPYRAFPNDSEEKIYHRLMLREQVFHHLLTAHIGN